MMTTASMVRMVRRGTPLASAAANRRSKRGPLSPADSSSPPATGSVIDPACQVGMPLACQHEGNGRRYGSGTRPETRVRHDADGTGYGTADRTGSGLAEGASTLVVPGSLREPERAHQCRCRGHLPLLVLCGVTTTGQPPGGGRVARAHSHPVRGPRAHPPNRRVGCVYRAHPRGVASARAPSIPTVPDQPVILGPQPRVAGRGSSGGGALVPTGHPVGSEQRGLGIRPRHAGNRLRRRAQRTVLAGTGGVSGGPRFPPPHRPAWRSVHLWIDPG